MADRSGIEWTDATWNPVTGCTKVSPGCDHCYAERVTERFGGKGSFEEIALHEVRLSMPMQWKRPRRVFVNSMSDLFHDDIPDEYVARVFAVMALAQQHTFQVLTKRHGRMRSLLSNANFWHLVAEQGREHHIGDGVGWLRVGAMLGGQPLANVWLGVSVENQQWADIRIPALLDTPAAVRWLSCEPLLGQINLLKFYPQRPVGFNLAIAPLTVAAAKACRLPVIDWVVAGGESGPGARPMHPDWARSLRDQCVKVAMPFFFKQHGEWSPIGPLYPLDDDDPDDYDDAHMEAMHLEVIEKRQVVQLERDGYIAEGHQPGDPRTWLMGRVGKRHAGRELDGRTWDEYP